MKREVRQIHWYTAEKEKTNDTKVIKDQTYCINQTYRLIFKDKGHKSLEYCCLVIHLTSVISTISNPESNGGIFILIVPLGITKHYETYCE